MADVPLQPRSLAEGQLLLGLRVCKTFEDPETGRPRQFYGTVTEVSDEYLDEDRCTQKMPNDELLYHVTYEDGDQEAIESWEELQGMLARASKRRKSIKKETATPGAALGPQQQTPHVGLTAPSQGAAATGRRGRRQTAEEENAAPSGHQTQGQEMGGNKRGRGVLQEQDTNVQQEEDDAAGRAKHPGKRQKQPAQTQETQEGEAFEEFDAKFQRAQAAQQRLEQQAQEPAAAPAGRRRGKAQAPAQPPADAEQMEEDDSEAVRGSRKVGLPGQLKRIRLENFMCHECFEMEFGPHVTLVSGTNGSGKSAVMQGLQVCLGVSAKTTGRAANMGAFIRTGAHEARVQVTLWNRGPGAFEPERFGDEITLERKILRSGGGYRVLDERGKSVGSSRDLVRRILDDLNVEAGNPLVVITQDMARNFLAGGPKEKRLKYEMFMSGTLLQDVADAHRDSRMKVDETKRILSKQVEAHKIRKQQLKELDNKIEVLESIDRDLAVKYHIHDVVAWEEPWARRKNITQLEDQLANDIPQRLHQHREEVAAKEEEWKAAKAAAEAKQEEVERWRNAAANVVEEITGLKARMKDAAGRRRQLEGSIKDKARTLADLKAEANGLQAELNQETGDNSERVEEARAALAAHQAHVQELRGQADAYQNEFNVKRNERNQLNEELKVAQGAQQKIEQELVACRAQIRRAEEELRAVQQAVVNRVSFFGGAPVLRLLDRLRASRRQFKYEPIGPVGAHLELRQNEWGPAIECQIGMLLNRFICFDSEDSAKLRQLAAQVGYPPSNLVIYTTTPSIPRHTFNRWVPQSELLIEDVLNITGLQGERADAVYNMLVDAGKVETTVLKEDENEARNIVYNAKYGAQISVVTKACAIMKKTQGTITVSQKGVGRPRLGAELDRQQQQFREVIEQERSREATLMQQLREAGGEVQARHANVKQLDNMCIDLTNRRKAILKELDKLRGQEEALDNAAQDRGEEQDVHMKVATQKLQSIQVETAEIEMSVAETQGKIAEIRKQEAELKEDCSRRADAQRQQAANWEAMVQECKDLGQQAAVLEQALQEARAALAAAEAEEQQCKARLQAAQDNLPGVLEAASQLCSEEEAQASLRKVTKYMEEKVHDAVMRKARGMTAEQVAAKKEELLRAWTTKEALEKEAAALEARQAAAEREAGGSLEEFCKQRDRETKEVALHEGKLAKSLAAHRNVEKGMVSREEAYHNLRTSMARTVQANFTKYMRRRMHVGRINICHDSCELELEVQIKGREQPQAPWVKDLKQLSGGERSYTTVAFLLATGQAIEAPFRCLDEFDVFMDQIHRRIATETLLEFALDTDERQYVLLTPQDIQAVEDAKQTLALKRKAALPEGFVKVVQMKAARANATQGILGYEENQLVSTDFVNDARSSIVDAPCTQVIDSTMVKIYARYDNEWGYSARLVEVAGMVAKSL